MKPGKLKDKKLQFLRVLLGRSEVKDVWANTQDADHCEDLALVEGAPSSGCALTGFGKMLLDKK